MTDGGYRFEKRSDAVLHLVAVPMQFVWIFLIFVVAFPRGVVWVLVAFLLFALTAAIAQVTYSHAARAAGTTTSFWNGIGTRQGRACYAAAWAAARGSTAPTPDDAP
jgi:hypothetical protein